MTAGPARVVLEPDLGHRGAELGRLGQNLRRHEAALAFKFQGAHEFGPEKFETTVQVARGKPQQRPGQGGPGARGQRPRGALGAVPAKAYHHFVALDAI